MLRVIKHIIPANKKKLPSQASNYNTDERLCHIWKHLSDLFESPEVRVLKTLQDLVKTTSAKKNLKRTNEAKTKFKFVRGGKELLIYVFFINR